jgi:hypothetical protein
MNAGHGNVISVAVFAGLAGPSRKTSGGAQRPDRFALHPEIAVRQDRKLPIQPLCRAASPPEGQVNA